MNIGIMTVNDFDFHPNARFREEAQRLGLELTLINPYAMGCRLNSGRPGIFFSSGIKLPDLILPRQGAPMGEYGFVLLRQFAAMNIPMVNTIRGVAVARNQYLTLQCLASAGLSVPDSCFVTDVENALLAVDQVGGYPVVFKQVNGLGGEGVVRIAGEGEARQYLARAFEPAMGLVVQSYIPPGGRRDLRLLVIGGRVAGAMSLTPCEGGFKANIHQKGTAQALDPSGEISSMAVAASRACHLSVAGVDIMQDDKGGTWVSEVNYSPGFRGLEEATGLNIAGIILDYALDQGRVKP